MDNNPHCRIHGKMRGTDKVGYTLMNYVYQPIMLIVTHFMCPAHLPAKLIMWVIFDKPTLSTHDPYYQSINLVYRRPISHLFDKPTLSVNKHGLSNWIRWVRAINLLALSTDNMSYFR